MQVTVLSDTKPIGKTKEGTKHPITGHVINKHFNNEIEFAEIIQHLQSNQCFTVGLLPDTYTYVPQSDIASLTKPKHITRMKQNMKPGHILLIDCDFPIFHHLKGPELHTFLEAYLPDIFKGAAYVTTNSTSYYTKGKKAFHQYYFFKNPTDLHQLVILLDKLFSHHNLVTYSLASNYSRTYIKTPIDNKLHELQQPIFECGQARLNLLEIETHPTITTYPGHIITAASLWLPNIDTGNAQANIEVARQVGEEERRPLLEEYLKEHGSKNVQKDSTLLESHILSAGITIVASTPGEKQNMRETSVLKEIITLIQLQTNPHELYYAIGEPDYVAHQTAKLFYNDPYELGSYTMVDQAHGGTKYSIIYTYEDLDNLLVLASQAQPHNFIKLLTAKNDLTAGEAQLLGRIHSKPFVTPSQLTKELLGNEAPIMLEESDGTLDIYDITTSLASLERNRVNLSNNEKMIIQKGIDMDRLFNAKNIQIIRDSVYSVNRDDVLLKPGHLHDFNIGSRQSIVKQLSPLYPTTNISGYADEVVLDALIQKYTATNKVESIEYRASMHGEKMYFGDGQVSITYQQQRPSFERIPTPMKMTLDSMSSSTYSEFYEMYMTHSMGSIWATISELSYIKKINPELKKDFLHIHLPSDAGKTFNMNIANLITPYERTNLDQFFEQAAKISPISIAKSAFLFHDEVKNFHHQWNELGAFYNIKKAYAADSISTQLPLKVLASAEDVMRTGTQQQMNRLMTLKPDIRPFSELGIKSEHETFMSAVTHQVIYDAFKASYDKYALMPEQKAFQMAITAGNSYGAALSPKDMVVTGDYIMDAIRGYLLQELVDFGSSTVLPSTAMLDSNNNIHRYIKLFAVKDNILYVNFKKQSASNFIEAVLRETTSSIESRSMNYEALSTTWEDLGCTQQKSPRTIGGKSGFYGYILELQIKE